MNMILAQSVIVLLNLCFSMAFLSAATPPTSTPPPTTPPPTTPPPTTASPTTPPTITPLPSGWNTIDSRPLPAWFDDAKIGVFIHWGVYSVPSYQSEWFWMDWKGNPSPNKEAQKKIEKFIENNFRPGFTYQEFAEQFTAEFFNATQWADLIEKSGAKYVLLTSKHHDGYALWPSKYSYSWNSVDVGPHRDIVGELAEAIKVKTDIRFGLYHSLYEWFNPLWMSDKANHFRTDDFVVNKVYPEMKELVNKYQPEIFWSDGEWEASADYWKSIEFLTWLYNESPVKDTVVVNDRWGHDTLCKHGGYYTCKDRYNPGTLQNHKWENAMTIDSSTWGYNRVSNIDDYLTPQDLIDTLVSTVACGGNMVMNVGPAKDGTINPIFQERLLQVGSWLRINGEAIYGSKPWNKCQNDTVVPYVWYTSASDDGALYAIMLRWPKTNMLYLGCVNSTQKVQVTMLGFKQQLPTSAGRLMKISLPDKSLISWEWGWVLKIEIQGYKVYNL
ncbi:alpha-L-fucosidase [Cimex lectularius]|uniref:Putative alpha-L-fucosidase n=1 Tax=Cimex lectularius TaxID=79782 RepID=A0A8I6SBG4_CIMLE|nr:alpha-L-fucosidase [Cimex lectularius]